MSDYPATLRIRDAVRAWDALNRTAPIIFVNAPMLEKLHAEHIDSVFAPVEDGSDIWMLDEAEVVLCDYKDAVPADKCCYWLSVEEPMEA